MPAELELQRPEPQQQGTSLPAGGLASVLTLLMLPAAFALVFRRTERAAG